MYQWNQSLIRRSRKVWDPPKKWSNCANVSYYIVVLVYRDILPKTFDRHHLLAPNGMLGHQLTSWRHFFRLLSFLPKYLNKLQIPCHAEKCHPKIFLAALKKKYANQIVSTLNSKWKLHSLVEARLYWTQFPSCRSEPPPKQNMQ